MSCSVESVSGVVPVRVRNVGPAETAMHAELREQVLHIDSGRGQHALELREAAMGDRGNRRRSSRALRFLRRSRVGDRWRGRAAGSAGTAMGVAVLAAGGVETAGTVEAATTGVTTTGAGETAMAGAETGGA